jgi:predicted nucleic acid-binding protein
MVMIMEHGMTQQGKPKKRGPRLEVTNPNAAGIDIGCASHYVAVPADRDDEPVREFSSFTVDVHKLADWLQACGVDTVAMESTGVYWIPVYEILERRGFTVLLVNARHVKNVAGRKSDVLDCQWLQQLHSYGLLRGAFRPADQVCVLRSLNRQRAMLLRMQARHIQVDSSVWIDFFRGTVTPQTERLDALLGAEPLVVGDLILAEVLQGFSSERDFNRAKQLLTALDVVELGGQEIAIQAARNFRTLRARGVTIRKTIDTLIATRCIESDYSLLFSDRDFDPFVEYLGLRSAMAEN